MQRGIRPFLGLLAGALALGAPALAQDHDEAASRARRSSSATPRRPAVQRSTSFPGALLEIVYLNSPGHPTNLVPGLGVPFDPGGSSIEAFRRPYFSSDGAHWAIEADADLPSATDNVYIVDGTLFLQEGKQAPWAPAGELVGFLDDQIAINTSGAIVITNGTDGSAPTSADDYVVSFGPTGLPTVLAKEGQLADSVVPALAGVRWDDSLDNALLTDAGLAGWGADGIDGTAGGLADDEVCVLGSLVVAREGDVPAGQMGGSVGAWENFDLDEYFVSPDGTTILILGDTDAVADDDVLVLNGTVVLQENRTIPGGPFNEPIDTAGIVKSHLDEANVWWARGNNDITEQDWVVRNGVVIAMSNANQEIVPGTGEHWDDADYAPCFFAFDGNSAGAYVLGGVTDATATSNGVLVFDDGAGNRHVLCREGDPIDYDGDGLFDDDRFFNTFGDDDVALLENGAIWFVATIEDSTGSAVDQGLFRLVPKWSRYGLSASPVNSMLLDGSGTTSLGGIFAPKITNVGGPFTVTGISLAPASFPLYGGVGLVHPGTLLAQVYVGVPVGGAVTNVIQVPNQQVLVGIDAYFQALGRDFSKPAGWALSNGLQATICQ